MLCMTKKQEQELNAYPMYKHDLLKENTVELQIMWIPLENTKTSLYSFLLFFFFLDHRTLHICLN